MLVYTYNLSTGQENPWASLARQSILFSESQAKERSCLKNRVPMLRALGGKGTCPTSLVTCLSSRTTQT